MRSLCVLAAALLALAACDDDDTPPGKAEGEACGSERECQRGLVCFERVCARGYAASPSCTLPATPVLVAGAAVLADPPPLPPDPNACVRTVRDPVAELPFVDLLEARVGTRLTFTLPPGSSGFTIVSQEVDDSAVDTFVFRGFLFPNTVVPTDVREPGGALFFSDTEPYPTSGRYTNVTDVLAYYGGFSPVSGSFTVPNTAASLDLARTAGALPGGEWSFVVNDWAYECLGIDGCSLGSSSGMYRVHVYPRPGPFVSTGALDLEVYLATESTGGWADAAAAAADPQMRRWVNGLAAYLARAGICLGTVTLHDLPQWAKDRYAPGGVVDISGGGMGLPRSETPPGCDDLSQLFTVALEQRRAVHVFLADELRDATVPFGFTVLGVDGSIPGPSGVPGTVNGGAIVGVFDLLGAEATAGACAGPGGPAVRTCGTDALAYVAAHEAGHWLGLYHTTEFDGTVFDPLSDTATCACLSCAPRTIRWQCAELDPIGGGTEVLNAYCSGASGSPTHCGGGRNLMFWLFDDAFAAGELTRQQGEVMRLNPAVR